jgi:hypothetical protein
MINIGNFLQNTTTGDLVLVVEVYEDGTIGAVDKEDNFFELSINGGYWEFYDDGEF